MGQIVGKKRFRELCGGTTELSAKHLNTYISRNKVIIESDGMIDIDNEVNQAFITSRLNTQKKSSFSTVVPTPKKKTPQEPKKLKANSKAESFDNEENNEGTQYDLNLDVKEMTMAQLQTEKERRTVQKLGEEIELKRIQKEKLMGVVIPTDVVKAVFARQMKAIVSAFSQGVNDVSLKVAHRFSPSKQEIADLKKELIGVVNDSIKESSELGMKEIKSIVNEYSEVRGRGEKKA